ncbi:MAG: hypothetical protein LBR36_00055 [Bacteroidales bacterium]|jgi:hypothetical protein|nr:hypothetical protein [Bacteroidales bacterium]
MKTRIVISLLFMSLTFVQAQNYASLRLQYIGKMLPPKSIPAKDSIFNCPKVLQGKMLTVSYNDKNEIAHLGISLFSKESKELINKPICDFIERVMLDLLLNYKINNLTNKLEEYHISLIKNNLQAKSKVTNVASLLNTMKEPVQFHWQQLKDSYWVLWEFANGESLEMTFPSNRELIFGTNKKEAEFVINEQLPPSHCKDSFSMPYYFSENELDKVDTGKDFYSRNGNFFIVEQLNNQQICKKDSNGRFYPLFDNNLPEISLKNLLLTPQMQSNLKLHIKHRMYGRFTPEFEIKLNDFTCFFENDCQSYAFAECDTAGKINVYLVLHSVAYNYIHLLLLTCSKETLFDPNGVIEAELFTHIPQDNIKNLFH